MPKKILLADDSITIQKVVELTFSDGDYEVVATNNGAKAIQKLSEMRPDIILSDIIMPEKNGYEVCEYVKSHPEFRNIPVILLTGTFEPFDPDRAEKAGCDAVVTKPFESQSLIQKVEELIQQASSSSPSATEPAPAPPPAFEMEGDEPVAAPPSPASPYSMASKDESPFAPALPPASNASFDDAGDSPFAPSAPPPAHGGEIFTSESDPNPPEASMPFDTPPPAPSAEYAGETRAFPRMSFEELQRMQTPDPMESEPAETERPYDAPPASAPASTASPFAEDSEPEPPAFEKAAPAPEYPGETRAFPRMSFEELQRVAADPHAPLPNEPEPSPWQNDEPPAAEPEWSSPDSSVAAEESPFEGASSAAAEPFAPAAESAPGWSSGTRTSAPSREASFDDNPSMNTSSISGGASSGELSEEQIDRIARRVVQLMSDQVVRNIAWEVIPDLAEVIVKERIRQLESE